MAATKRDYYEVLEVTRTAVSEEIKKSYRRLAVRFHPDKNPGDPHAEEHFKELGEAYDVLMDDQKRAAYDRFGHAAFAQGTAGAGAGGFHDPFDLFREVFGGAAGGGGGIFEQFFGGAGGGTREARHRGPGMFHQLKIGDTVLLHGHAIGLLHLTGCQKFHRIHYALPPPAHGF